VEALKLNLERASTVDGLLMYSLMRLARWAHVLPVDREFRDKFKADSSTAGIHSVDPRRNQGGSQIAGVNPIRILLSRIAPAAAWL